MRLLAAIAAATLATAAATLRKGAAAGVLNAASAGTVAAIGGCNGEGGKCGKNSDCCDPYVCNSEGKCKPCYETGYDCKDSGQCCSGTCSSGKNNKCIDNCYQEGYNCETDSQCCTGLSCGVGGQCSTCNGHNGNCNTDGDCCDSYWCHSGQCKDCIGKGSSCDNGYGSECCSGLSCQEYLGGGSGGTWPSSEPYLDLEYYCEP